MMDDEFLLVALLGALAADEDIAQPQAPQFRPLMTQGGSSVVLVPPLYSSGEIGTVDASTVVITFDQNITASNYATGVTIKVNTVTQVISSATRQANHAIVYYVIPEAEEGDTVTWQYTGGNIAAEDDATALATVTAQNVTNNIVAEGTTPILELQASNTSGVDGQPLSTFTDLSGNARHFTQTGSNRPLWNAGGGNPYITLDGVDDWMEGPNFADNLSQFTVMVALHSLSYGVVIGKIDVDAEGNEYVGWLVIGDGTDVIFSLQNTGEAANIYRRSASPIATPCILTCEKVSNSELHIYLNGVLSDGDGPFMGTVTTFSNAVNVLIGVEGGAGGADDEGYSPHEGHAYLIYDTVLETAEREAKEAELATEYGITL